MSMSDDEVPPEAAAIVELLNSRPHSVRGESLAVPGVSGRRVSLLRATRWDGGTPAQDVLGACLAVVLANGDGQGRKAEIDRGAAGASASVS